MDRQPLHYRLPSRDDLRPVTDDAAALAVGAGAQRFHPRAPHFVQLRLHLRDPLELHLELPPQIVDDLAALVQHFDDVVVLRARDVRAV